MTTHYDLLKVSRDADADTIRKAYLKIVVGLHPDKNLESKESDRFINVHEAYAVLSNSERRRAYDRMIGSADIAFMVPLQEDEKAEEHSLVQMTSYGYANTLVTAELSETYFYEQMQRNEVAVRTILENPQLTVRLGIESFYQAALQYEFAALKTLENQSLSQLFLLWPDRIVDLAKKHPRYGAAMLAKPEYRAVLTGGHFYALVEEYDIGVTLQDDSPALIRFGSYIAVELALTNYHDIDYADLVRNILASGIHLDLVNRLATLSQQQIISFMVEPGFVDILEVPHLYILAERKPEVMHYLLLNHLDAIQRIVAAQGILFSLISEDYRLVVAFINLGGLAEQALTGDQLYTLSQKHPQLVLTPILFDTRNAYQRMLRYEHHQEIKTHDSEAFYQEIMDAKISVASLILLGERSLFVARAILFDDRLRGYLLATTRYNNVSQGRVQAEVGDPNRYLLRLCKAHRYIAECVLNNPLYYAKLDGSDLQCLVGHHGSVISLLIAHNPALLHRLSAYNAIHQLESKGELELTHRPITDLSMHELSFQEGTRLEAKDSASAAEFYYTAAMGGHERARHALARLAFRDEKRTAYLYADVMSYEALRHDLADSVKQEHHGTACFWHQIAVGSGYPKAGFALIPYLRRALLYSRKHHTLLNLDSLPEAALIKASVVQLKLYRQQDQAKALCRELIRATLDYAYTTHAQIYYDMLLDMDPALTADEYFEIASLLQSELYNSIGMDSTQESKDEPDAALMQKPANIAGVLNPPLCYLVRAALREEHPAKKSQYFKQHLSLLTSIDWIEPDTAKLFLEEDTLLDYLEPNIVLALCGSYPRILLSPHRLNLIVYRLAGISDDEEIKGFDEPNYAHPHLLQLARIASANQYDHVVAYLEQKANRQHFSAVLLALKYSPDYLIQLAQSGQYYALLALQERSRSNPRDAYALGEIFEDEKGKYHDLESSLEYYCQANALGYHRQTAWPFVRFIKRAVLEAKAKKQFIILLFEPAFYRLMENIKKLPSAQRSDIATAVERFCHEIMDPSSLLSISKLVPTTPERHLERANEILHLWEQRQRKQDKDPTDSECISTRYNAVLSFVFQLPRVDLAVASAWYQPIKALIQAGSMTVTVANALLGRSIWYQVLSYDEIIACRKKSSEPLRAEVWALLFTLLQATPYVVQHYVDNRPLLARLNRLENILPLCNLIEREYVSQGLSGLLGCLQQAESQGYEVQRATTTKVHYLQLTLNALPPEGRGLFFAPCKPSSRRHFKQSAHRQVDAGGKKATPTATGFCLGFRNQG